MRSVKNYKEIKIWQKGDLVFDMVCEDVERWPNTKVANIISYQVLKSSGSISANVAEGYGRGTPGEFEQFLRYSRGSSAETDNWLYKTKKRNLISEKRYGQYESLLEEINKMIGSFIRKPRTQPRKRTR